LMMEFKHIQKAFWGRHVWARGYFVAKRVRKSILTLRHS
jgi:REP element-mobilizing transposase RayT